jgi:hypothetical protein
MQKNDNAAYFNALELRESSTSEHRLKVSFVNEVSFFGSLRNGILTVSLPARRRRKSADHDLQTHPGQRD